MLKQLSINDFALIANANISFHKGFTAITGETGAGKSILLKALRLICGDKSQNTLVRSLQEKAVIEGTFDISEEPQIKELLDKFEIDYDDEIIIRREILNNGKGRARINGTIVSLVDLQEIGENLIQMHGQSEQIMLRDTRTHTQMLDDYAQNKDILLKYNHLWNKWNNLLNTIKSTENRAKDLASQKDFLKFQFDELNKANLSEKEEETLEEKINLASKGEAEFQYINEIQKILDCENGLLDKIQILQSKLRSLANKVPKYDETYNALTEVSDPFESICKDLMRISPTKSISPLEIDKANERIAFIQKLKRKYRTDVQGLIALKEKREEELSCLENLDFDLEQLEKEKLKCRKEIEEIAKELSDNRKNSAKKFDNAIQELLQKLGMPKAKFYTSITPQELSTHGMDKIEFMLAPNPGEGEKSLQKAVSGGELSRVLLAIKSVMAELDKVPLLIFDEVDSGISGEIANSIGKSLKNLGKHHQVLTITHLHQVACCAKNHLAVKKEEIEGRTFTTIKELDENAKVDELVRMIGGESESVREHAKQLLERSK